MLAARAQALAIFQAVGLRMPPSSGPANHRSRIVVVWARRCLPMSALDLGLLKEQHQRGVVIQTGRLREGAGDSVGGGRTNQRLPRDPLVQLVPVIVRAARDLGLGDAGAVD